MTTVHTAYCPRCRVVTNLSVSITLLTVTERAGKRKWLPQERIIAHMARPSAFRVPALFC
jgi:hypothetical protein